MAEFAFYVNKNGQRSRKDFIIYWEGLPTGFGAFHVTSVSCGELICSLSFPALMEPYVLAFEPSFVEIRNIETGLMSQVIQGNNLRLLFADNPPSVTNGAGHPAQPQHPAGGPGYEFNPYAPQGPAGMYGSRSSVYSGYGAGGGPIYGQQHPANPYARNAQRDEIIMVSDDRVLAIRTLQASPVQGGQRVLQPGDGASVMGFVR